MSSKAHRGRRAGPAARVPEANDDVGEVLSGRRRGRRLHWWNRGSGIRLRLWMAFNLSVLAVLSYGVFALVQANATGPDYDALGARNRPDLVKRLTKPNTGPVVPDRSQFLKPHPGEQYFGVSTPRAPWVTSKADLIAKAAGGQRPTMVEYFVKWSQGFDPAAVRLSYQQGLLPVLTWEPWTTGKEFEPEPGYSLRSIYTGKHDAYIRKFAKGIAQAKWPVALRFAHEMNGNWFPWSEQYFHQMSYGNKRGEFIKAWRHVHDVFEQVGADNVIWVWSPNIIKPIPKTPLKRFWPGSKYVDWIGLTGYAVGDRTPEQTFGPTLKQIRALSSKPVLITETGVEPGKLKPGWIKRFFPWLKRNHDLIGFIWFEQNKAGGGAKRADWRFESDPASQDAFRRGVAGLRLVGTKDAQRSEREDDGAG